MSDRLAELHRQRALLTEHLAWLDGEIAKAIDQSGMSQVPTTLPSPATTSSEPSPPAMAVNPRGPAQDLAAGLRPPTPAAGRPVPSDAAAIIEQYRSSPASMQRDLRKGCFLYFAGALVLLGLGVLALYFMFRSR